ncbi:MAG: twin-arginine translocase subunit TatC [Polyangiaceae bacterium]
MSDADVEAPKKPKKKKKPKLDAPAPIEVAPAARREPPKAAPDPPPEPEAPENDKPMTFWEHLEELRTRIIRSAIFFLIACGFAWWQKENLLAFIAKPFCDAWVKEGVTGKCSLNFASPQAPFMSYAKLSAIVGLAGAAPIIFYQLWGFIAPGLYSREKRYIYPFVFASTLLFIGGAWFGFLAAFPLAFGYFLGMAGDHGTSSVLTIAPVVTMESYIDFVTQMLLGFGIIFEIPIVLSFLALVGIVNHKMLIKFARYYILVAFIAAAILTPPDVTSQLVMAVPACLLYGVSIGLVWLMQKKAPA